jgi:hypothetical protein
MIFTPVLQKSTLDVISERLGNSLDVTQQLEKLKTEADLKPHVQQCSLISRCQGSSVSGEAVLEPVMASHLQLEAVQGASTGFGI